MKKSSKKVIIIAVIISILVILIATGVIAYFTTDLFKSNQELFFKYLIKNNEMISTYMENPNKDTINSIKSNKYTEKGNITFDLVSSDTQIANRTIPARNFSIEYDKQADTQAKKDSMQAILKFLNNDLFKLKYAHNNDLYALASDEVINKYLTFDNNNIKELVKKYGIEDETDIPNKLPIDNFEQVFTITTEDEKYLIDTYLNVIKNEIPKEEYYAKKDVRISIEDKEIQANCYGISIEREQVKNLAIHLLEELQQDYKTLDLIIEKIAIISPETQITVSNLIEEISKMINEIENNNDIQGLRLEVYESEGKLVRTVIETESEDKITIDYKLADNGAIKILISTEYDYANENSIINPNNNIGNNENVNSNVNVTIGNTQNRNMGLRLKNVEIAKQENDNVMIFTFELNDKVCKVTLMNKEETQGQSNVNTNKTIIISDSDTTYFTIKINSVLASANEVTIEELTEQNSVTINKFTPEYTTNLMNAITKRLQQLYAQKMQIVNTVQQEENANRNNNTNQEQQNQNTNI